MFTVTCNTAHTGAMPCPAELALCGYDVAGAPSIQLSQFPGDGARYGMILMPALTP